LLDLVRYIHLNPGRLKVPVDPWWYRWSSVGVYLGGVGPVKVDTQDVLRQFSSQVGTARRGYQRFIEEGMKQGHDEKYYQTLDQRFLGEDSFVQEVAQRTEAKEIEIKREEGKF
jgi:hypothetical protein